MFSKITSSKGKGGQQAESLLKRAGDAEGSCSEGEGGIAQECSRAFGGLSELALFPANRSRMRESGPVEKTHLSDGTRRQSLFWI